MASKIFHSPRVDSRTLVDDPNNIAAGTSSVLAAMKALSESHRVLETILLGAYHKSRELPLSGDQKLSILCLLLFLVYCFILYPYFLCPTKDIPGPFFTSTAIGDQLHGYYKQHNSADQWTLSLHEKHSSVVRLAPTVVSVNDPAILPSSKNTYSRPLTASNGQVGDDHLFASVTEDVVKDLKLALRGQKTVDVHNILSRHLQQRAPAPFATALAHIIYQLAHPMHRHYLNRLAKEIQATENADVADLDLLNAVVKESLRMQQAPNHHATTFVVKKGGCILGAYELEQGTNISASLYCICRSSAIFTQSNEYNPMRWIESSKSATMDQALDFVLAYHRSIKPGFDTTLAHLKLLLATMLKTFDIKLPLGEQPKQVDVVSLRTGGCRVRFRERKQVVEKTVRFAEHVIM